MHKNVELLIGRLATDPGLLDCFAKDARAVLEAQGLELTPVEIEALAGIDHDALGSFARSLDRRLRKAARAVEDGASHDPGERSMKSSPWPRLAALAALLICPAVDVSAEEWKLSLTPYAWATDVSVDARLGSRELVDHTIAFTDLLKDLDAVVQVRLEGTKGEHGFLVDLFDVSLSPEAARLTLPGSGTPAVVGSQVGMTLLEVAGTWDPGGDQRGFSFLYGARLLSERADIDGTLETDPVTTLRHDVNETTLDALVGVRYARPLSDRWTAVLRADLSKGGTELTWSGSAEVRYALGRRGRYELTAGYRHLVVDFDSADAADLDMTLSGFQTGLRISF